MRYRGKEYTGKGVIVAVVDSGVNPLDPRMVGRKVQGWSVAMKATNHAALSADFHDDNGHGTEMTAAILRMAPEAEVMAVRIMDRNLRTSADLMAAGIETAYRAGAHVISLSLGTPNMGKALLLRDACALAVENGSVVLAAAHPKGDRAYPADLPETVGVATHPDCPLEKFYFFAPHRFPRSEWGNLTGKFLTHGYELVNNERGGFKGSGIATAYLAGRFACLREALAGETVPGVVEMMSRQALTPVPEIGYA
jgi:subtilisin family serine protease